MWAIGFGSKSNEFKTVDGAELTDARLRWMGQFIDVGRGLVPAHQTAELDP
jgi:hypothetical protein